MQCSFAFNQAPSGDFLVLLECVTDSMQSIQGATLMEFQSENDFIENIVLGVSSNDAITAIIGHLLRSISDRRPTAEWVTVDLPEWEIASLGLKSMHISSSSVPER
jgi:hypothetical protein